VPAAATFAIRTPLILREAFCGSPSKVHHTAEKSPSKSNVRCSVTCNAPSVSTWAWISTFGIVYDFA